MIDGGESNTAENIKGEADNFFRKFYTENVNFSFYGKHERQRDEEADRQAIIKHRTVGEIRNQGIK